GARPPPPPAGSAPSPPAGAFSPVDKFRLSVRTWYNTSRPAGSDFGDLGDTEGATAGLFFFRPPYNAPARRPVISSNTSTAFLRSTTSPCGPRGSLHRPAVILVLVVQLQHLDEVRLHPRRRARMPTGEVRFPCETPTVPCRCGWTAGS